MNDINFTPDPRGEGYQPVEFQIAAEVIKFLNWEENSYGFTASSGIVWDAKKSIMGYGMAAAKINNVSQLPADWYKNGKVIYEMYTKAKNTFSQYASSGNVDIVSASAEYFYRLRLEFGGEYTENIWKVPGLENKKIGDYTIQDKILATDYFSKQNLPFEEHEPSELSRYLNALNWLLIVDQALLFGESFLEKGFLESVSKKGIKESLSSEINLVEKLPSSLKGADLGGEVQVVKEVANLSSESPYLFFTDTYKGKPRLNVLGHGVLTPEGMATAGLRTPVGIKNPFDVSMDILELTENGIPFENIRCLGCRTADGGINSFAQKLADYTGTPVKGYQGTVFCNRISFRRAPCHHKR